MVRPQGLKDLLHGTWLGHPLHPVLVQVPVGAFISAAVLDLVPGGRRAAGTLIGVGVGGRRAGRGRRARRLVRDDQGSPPGGAGACRRQHRRAQLYVGSLAARLSGRPARGRALAFAGLSAAGAGAYLGGHVSFAQGGGMNQAAPDIGRIPEEWTAVAQLAELPDGKPVVRTVEDVPILLYRVGGRVTALLERCSHETGPLGDGEVVGSGLDACVVCPWHGSTFRLADGTAVHGPAANDQPTLRARVSAGVVEVAQP